MAITKLLRIKENKGSGSPSAGLLRCIKYVLDPEKTDGTQGFHYVISFSPSEDVSPELALKIGNDFCHELLNDEHIFLRRVNRKRHHEVFHACQPPGADEDNPDRAEEVKHR